MNSGSTQPNPHLHRRELETRIADGIERYENGFFAKGIFSCHTTGTGQFSLEQCDEFTGLEEAVFFCDRHRFGSRNATLTCFERYNPFAVMFHFPQGFPFNRTNALRAGKGEKLKINPRGQFCKAEALYDLAVVMMD